MTEEGWEDRPIRWVVSRLTDQVSPAVTAIPSSAASAHAQPRRVTVITRSRYPGSC